MKEGIDRRTFVARAAAAGAAITLPAALPFAERAAASAGRVRARRTPLAPTGAFVSGVSSGQPNLHGITLWTRVDGLERTSDLALEVASDPDFRDVVVNRRVRASSVRDFTAHTRVLTRRLRAGERYWYRFATATTSSPVGRFKTARPADSREPVRIGYFSCQAWEAGYFTAHAGLAREDDLDLVICGGDYVYERPFYHGPRVDTTGVERDGEVQTLPEYREKYRLYKSDPDLQAMHAAHPYVAIWDDHEVENNHAGDNGGGQAATARRIPYLERRRAAYLAFFENHPLEAIRSERFRIYRKLRLGGNADVFLLDERQYRDLQPCNDGVLIDCAERDAPRDMLGPAQLQWLKAGLDRSGATWKLIGNQVMFMGLDVPTGQFSMDLWDGYGFERSQIIGHIQQRGIRDVSFLTGDFHSFFAGDVHPGGRPRQGGGPAVATEFVVGSITSQPLADLAGPNAISDVVDEGATAAQQTFGLYNPHLAYVENRFRGYAVIEARPDELLVDFRSPQTIEQPTSAIRTLRRFRVAAGEPRVQTL